MDPNHHHTQQHHQPPTTHPPQHAQPSQPGYVPQQPAHNFQYTMQLSHHTQSFPRTHISPASYVSNVPYYGFMQQPYWQGPATFTRASAPIAATTTTTTPKAKPVREREIRRLRIVNPKTKEEVDLGASQKSTSDKGADDSHEDITIKKDDAEGEVKLNEEKKQSNPTSVDKNDHHEDVNDRDDCAKLENDRADIKVEPEQEEVVTPVPVDAEKINQQSNSENVESAEQQPSPIKAEKGTDQQTDPNNDEKKEQPSESASAEGTEQQDGVDNSDEQSAETGDSADGLHYEEGQFHPTSNRGGKKKYSRSFMVEVCEKICKFKIDTEVDTESNMPSYNLDRTDNFLPAYQQHVKYQSANSNRQNPNNYTGRSSAGQERQRKIILPSSSLTNEVELKTVSNPWRPGNKVKEEVPDGVLEVETLKKKFRSILNKLTPQNFDSLASAVTELHIDTEAKLGEVIDIVFAKALSEPGYCVLYGQMCSHLKKISAGTANFGNTLLKRCQNQFQADIYQGLDIDGRRKKIEEEEDPEKKKQLDEELYEDMFRCRMRGLGLIKFIGELYKIEMLIDTIMFDCIQRLLSDSSSEESIECLCDLLKTIGEKLDKSSLATVAMEKQKNQRTLPKPSNYRSAVASEQKAPEPVVIMTLNPIFDQLHKIRKSKDTTLSVRIRFKLLDLCELREKDNWQSKGKDNNPKKLDEIKKDHLESERQKSMGPRKSQEGRRGLGQGGGSSSQLSSLGNEMGPNRNSFHSSASSQSIRDHEHGEKTLRDNSDSHKQSEQHRINAANILDKYRSGKPQLETASSSAGPLRPTFLRGSTQSESLRPSYKANQGSSATKSSEQDVPK